MGNRREERREIPETTGGLLKLIEWLLSWLIFELI